MHNYLTSIVPLSKERVAIVNREAPKLAKFFFLNSKKKISYYRKSSFNSHYEVFNKGTFQWEYAAAIDVERLRHLPALSHDEYELDDDPSIEEVLSLGSVAKAEANAESICIHTDEVEAEVVVTNILCNNTAQEKEKTKVVHVKVGSPADPFEDLKKSATIGNLVILEDIKKEEGDSVSSNSQIDHQRLLTLFTEKLPKGFLLNYTYRELNYYVYYDHTLNVWEYATASGSQFAGVIYTNSLTCIRNVVDVLNQQQYTL